MPPVLTLVDQTSRAHCTVHECVLVSISICACVVRRGPYTLTLWQKYSLRELMITQERC